MCADPLVMDNGMDLIDMMCACYESAPDADEAVPQYNFSETPTPSAAASCTGHDPTHTERCMMNATAAVILPLAGTFKVCVLRKGAICVSAAVLRRVSHVPPCTSPHGDLDMHA